MKTRLLRFVLAALPIIAVSPPARADITKLECIRANEDGQDERRAGRFTAAIGRFEACARSSCPGSVRDDCAARLEETRRAFPRAEVLVTDAAGSPVLGARVSVDGNPQPSGSINAEPGEHQIEVTATGYVPVSKKLALRESSTVHQSIVLTTEPTSSQAMVVRSERDASTNTAAWPLGPPQRNVSFVVGGVGATALVVGSVLGVVAKGRYDSAADACGGRPSRCQNPTAIADGNDAHTLLTASTVTIVAGAVLLASGLALFLLSPRRESTTATLMRIGLQRGGAW